MKNQYKILGILLICFLFGSILGYTLAQSGNTFIISSGIYPLGSYTFYIESSTYYVKTDYGENLPSGTNITQITQNTITTASNGSTFIFTEGVFSFDQSFTLDKPIDFIGQGKGKTIFSFNAGVNATQITTGNEDITFEGISFHSEDIGVYGNQWATGTLSSLTTYGLSFLGWSGQSDTIKVKSIQIRDCEFSGWGYGIYFSWISWGRIESSDFRFNNNAIYMTKSTNTRILNNYADRNWRWLILTDSSHVAQDAGTIISNNQAFGNDVDMIVRYWELLQVYNNMFDLANSSNIVVSNSIAVGITDNYFSLVIGTNFQNIKVNGTSPNSTHITINNNQLRYGNWGIFLENAVNGTINGNEIREIVDSEILLTASKYIVVSSNRLESTSTWSIAETSTSDWNLIHANIVQASITTVGANTVSSDNIDL